MGILNTSNEVLTEFTHDVFHVEITKYLTQIIFHYKKTARIII